MFFQKTEPLIPPQLTWSQFFFEKMKNSGQSVIHWINPLSTLSQFWSLMSQLVWMIPEMLTCDFLTIIVILFFNQTWIEIPFQKKKDEMNIHQKKQKNRHDLAEYLLAALFLLFLQLPLLIQSWQNIGILLLIILFLANSGTAYYMKQHSDRNHAIGLLSLALLYLYLIGLWFIPMICFQVAFWLLICYLDPRVG